MRTLLNIFKRTAPPSTWSQRFFNVPLIDMGRANPKFQNIYQPEPEIGAAKIGITEQFLSNSQIYHQKYAHSEHMVELFKRSFEAVGFSPKSNPNILDLGAGSGKNSLLPMLTIFDNARFVATDLSPDLLEILRRYVDQEGLSDRVACVCTDAMNSLFTANSFDVVAGVAILHHLMDPALAIRAAYSALKEGGIAVFYDPFEGFGLLGLSFKMILDRAAREHLKLDDVVADFLRAIIIDFDARRGTDKTADRFKYMDDKWLFTRNYFEDVLRSTGFESVKVLARTNHATCFRDLVTDLLRLGLELTPNALPDWAWETIDLLDCSFSPEMKEDLVMEGAIIFKK